MVQLTDELVAELDEEAERTGVSRSALIRACSSATSGNAAMPRRSAATSRATAGTRPETSTSGATLAAQADRDGHELARRLAAEEEEAGLSW